MSLSERQLRWAAVSVLFLSSALNYLDRNILSALMPTLRQEFSVSGAQLGQVIAVFSLTYAFCSPLMGLLIDRIGLRAGAAILVGLWSLTGIATGFAAGVGALLGCRAFLGAVESGGIPATGKGSAVYLEPRDRALGSAVSQIGITLGIMGAPFLTEVVAVRWGWRSAFVAAGLLGLVWIPLWLWTSTRIPPPQSVAGPVSERPSTGAVLRDRRFLLLLVANAMAMTVYSLWTTWTTDFLVTTFRLTQSDANRHYAWIPPIFATLGGLFGGVVAQWRLGRSGRAIHERARIALVASLFVLLTAAAPLAGSPGLSVAFICVSYFSLLTMSVNYYSIPLDLFGPERAAWSTSFLTSVYGLMQVFLAPLIGGWSDRAGWAPVCATISVLPLASALLLRTAFRRT